jgi:bifunctional UDP-N-acetylglucosamine pyrophosphorylase/glucosamine-1-phosphate N-acetyltransferase
LDYSAVILAAGKGVRMRSQIPKVVHAVAGQPMVKHVVQAVYQAGVNKITLVVGHGRDTIENLFEAGQVGIAVQEQQLGTGHALMQAEKNVAGDGNIIVLAGDTPLIRAATIKALIDRHEESAAAATVLTTSVEDPTGYGRVLRNEDGSLNRIVEEKDANSEEKAIHEINSGMYCFKTEAVFKALQHINTSNAQNEYYLTDVLKIFIAQGQRVEIQKTDAVEDIYGINDRVQMAQAEAILRQRKSLELMQNGVTIMDPATTFIDAQVEIGSDTVILPFTMIQGTTVIGQMCEIGPSTRISDSSIGNNVHMENSRVMQAVVGDRCTIGPFAYLRPGAVLHDEVKVGDFVEIKKSVIGENSKVPHLSYVGDATVGRKVNIGAGTITCNYDGRNKYETILADGVFIGSNTNLVAPVKIGENSMTGAGSTITRDVPPQTLAVERAEQRMLSTIKTRGRK